MNVFQVPAPGAQQMQSWPSPLPGYGSAGSYIAATLWSVPTSPPPSDGWTLTKFGFGGATVMQSMEPVNVALYLLREMNTEQLRTVHTELELMIAARASQLLTR